MKLHHTVKGTFHFRDAEHPWEKATSAALTMGLCVLIGLLLGNISWGLLATVGGFTALYANNETYPQRALKLAVISVGLAISVALSTLSAGNVWLLAGTLCLVSMAATFVARSFQMLPPGGYFFILVCALGSGLPLAPAAAPTRFGFALLGGTLAWLISMSSALIVRRTSPPKPDPIRGPVLEALRRIQEKRREIIVPTLRMGIVVFAGTMIAFWFGDPRQYWVPLTCAAVLQGVTITATIQRTLQRALGTALGVVVGGIFLSLHPANGWLVLGLMFFQWFAEMFIVRNYGLAMIFITPIPLILAETGYPGMHPSFLVQARLLDTLIGCAIAALSLSLPWLHLIDNAQVGRKIK